MPARIDGLFVLFIIFLFLFRVLYKFKVVRTIEYKYYIEKAEIMRRDIIGQTYNYYELSHSLNSLARWRSFKPENYILGVLESDSRLREDLVMNVDKWEEFKNRTINELFLIEDELNEDKSISYFKRSIIKIKFIILKEQIYKEYYKVPITLTWTYTSPKGQNHYKSTEGYDTDNINSFLLALKKRQKHKQSKEYQRQLMTPSLRYDILKRDSYRCRICGITADEGAKLHIDHIKPVSKGGKTIKTNLQTLCDTCNLGKSDKY